MTEICHQGEDNGKRWPLILQFLQCIHRSTAGHIEVTLCLSSSAAGFSVFSGYRSLASKAEFTVNSAPKDNGAQPSTSMNGRKGILGNKVKEIAVRRSSAFRNDSFHADTVFAEILIGRWALAFGTI